MSTTTLTCLRSQLWHIVSALELATNFRTISYLGGHAAGLRFALELVDPEARWLDTHATFKRRLVQSAALEQSLI